MKFYPGGIGHGFEMKWLDFWY